MANRVADVAADLSAIVEASVPRLTAMDDEASLRTRGQGSWSRRQIVGHLIDSALNNVQRFIRGQQGGGLELPGYDQPFWVERGGYQERPWLELVGLWAALNRQLAHVIAGIRDERLATPCRIGGSEPLSLEFIVRDYVTHLRHHLDQVLDPEGSKGKAYAP